MRVLGTMHPGVCEHCESVIGKGPGVTKHKYMTTYKTDVPNVFVLHCSTRCHQFFIQDDKQGIRIANFS